MINGEGFVPLGFCKQTSAGAALIFLSKSEAAATDVPVHMKIHHDSYAGINRITSYGHYHVTVNGTTYSKSLIVTPTSIIDDWPPQTFDQILVEHMEALLQLNPEVVIIGTGPRQQFPGPEFWAGDWRKSVGMEFMDTPAACRTYNILAAESRRVAAGLIMLEG